jgi:hypothetical protein
MTMRKTWDKQELDEMLAAYAAGASSSKLGAKYGVSAHAICQKTSQCHVYRTVEALTAIRRAARLGESQ